MSGTACCTCGSRRPAKRLRSRGVMAELAEAINAAAPSDAVVFLLNEGRSPPRDSRMVREAVPAHRAHRPVAARAAQGVMSTVGRGRMQRARDRVHLGTRDPA